MRRLGAPGLVLLFLVAFGAAWVFGNPPGAAPDERDHYVKAIGVAGGDPLGDPPGQRDARSLTKEQFEGLAKILGQQQGDAPAPGGPEDVARTWQQRSNREFTVPAGLGFDAFGCNQNPQQSAECLEAGRRSTSDTRVQSFMGTYQPYLYVGPGLLSRAANDPLSALRLGRLATALLSLAFLAAAFLLLWERSRGALSVAGLFVALSPAVIFFASTLSTSGPEICAAVCFTASLIRITRETPAGGWTWLLAGISAGTLSLSRSLGPLFVLLAVVAVFALTDRRHVLAAVKRGGRGAIAAAAIAALGAVAGLVWQARYQPSLGFNRRAIRDRLDSAIEDLGEVARQLVGKFGSLEANLPLSLYIVWWLMFAVLLAGAFGLAGRRERLGLAGLAIGALVLTVALSAIYRQTDFPLQGRHVLPLIVILPLWAGEIMHRHAGRLSTRMARGFLYGLSGAAAAVHVLAWYANGRRFAVGVDGSWNWVSGADWLPPLGWVPWLIAVTAGAVCYLLAGSAAARALPGGVRNT